MRTASLRRDRQRPGDDEPDADDPGHGAEHVGREVLAEQYSLVVVATVSTPSTVRAHVGAAPRHRTTAVSAIAAVAEACPLG